MKITPSHLIYWQQRKTIKPSWASGMQENNRVDIDYLINIQIPNFNLNRNNELELINTITILKSWRKRGVLVEKMIECSLNDIASKKRKAIIKKWLKRIDPLI
jgi:hypothetical protein